MPIVEIVGLASGTSRFLNVRRKDFGENLLRWLRAQGVTIASSCDGDGVCKKCVIQNGWPTCEMTLEEFFERQPDGKIFVSYL